MRVAVGQRGVAVVVIPGNVALGPLAKPVPTWLLPAAPTVRPNDDELRRLAELLNGGSRITLFCGAGCAGAHDEVVELARKLKAPIVHALRGKEHIEYDNPFDVGMTGLLGFASGYWAMKNCDTLLLLGTDFPYRQFFPEKARIAQVDIRAAALGNRCPLDLGVVGTVRDTVVALLQTGLPVKIVVLNNGTLGFVEMEMKATGFLDTNVDLKNPNFAEMARAMGIKGVRVEAPQDLHAAVQEVLQHDGPALLDVVTARQELVMPPTTTFDEAHAFGMFMLKAVLDGRASELIDLAKVNLTR